MLEAKEVNFAYLRGQPVLHDIDLIGAQRQRQNHA